jgi:hypothetical protein
MEGDSTDESELPLEPEILVIERIALSDSADGRVISAAFVSDFGAFMTETVRPILRQVATDGGEPQLLVNGLAELLRLTAESIEAPLDGDR